MVLPSDLISEFVEITNDKTEIKTETTVYGTIVANGSSKYVKLDGSDLLTPISSTTAVEDGERVTVMIKDHSAVVTGNLSSPSARTATVDAIEGRVTEAEGLIKVSTETLEAEVARISALEAEDASIRGRLTANEASITNLNAENVTINGTLEAHSAVIGNLDSTYATIENLEATNGTIHNLETDYGNFVDLTTNNFAAVNGNIANLQTSKLDAETANVTYATIENLNAANADIENLRTNKLDASTASITYATIENLNAASANIENLRTNKLDAESAAITYANIDFSNIGEAAIRQFYSQSGVIQDVVISDGHVTGRLVGVTIKGDLIEGGTVVADKLVIKGEDGIYYKLNMEAGALTGEQTDYNSLSGSVITANSITAEKIAVDDLVAFDATIGGFNISENSIYSGVKSSVSNTTRGIYMDNDGQIAFGDSSNYIKFYKDTDGTYKLAISAQTIKMGASGSSVEEAVNEARTIAGNSIQSVDVEYYLSTSSISLTGGSWSTVAPEWVNGKYMWNRVKTTLGDGSVSYSDSTCIAGATGPKGEKGDKGDTGAQGIQGIQGEKGEQGIQGPKGDTGSQGPQGESGKTSYFHIKYSSVSNPTSSSQISETPSTYIGTYVDYTEADSSDPSKYTWSRFEGAQGEKGDRGIAGTNGADGKTSYLHIAYSNSSDGSSGFSVSDSSGKLYIGQYTDFTSSDSTDYTKYSWTKIKGETGSKGDTGATGNGVSSIIEQYYVSTSKDSQTGGSWSTTTPTWSTGKYIWTRSKITYTNGNIVYTTPYCDSTWEAINEVEVGGRNVLIRSDPSKYLSEWSTLNNGTIELQTGGYLKVTPGANAKSSGTFPPKLSTLESGEEYTVSFYAYADTDLCLNYNCIVTDDGNTVVHNYINITTTEDRYSFTFTTNESYSNCSIMIGYANSDVVTTAFYIKNLKVEKGNKATDWTPAPEDIFREINEVESVSNDNRDRLKSAESTIDSMNGLISLMVDGLNNASVMTQTEDGWKFDMSGIITDIKNNGKNIGDIQASLTGIGGDIEHMGDRITEVAEYRSYIDFTTTTDGRPCILLGKEDSPFKVNITNTNIEFKEGSDIPAYISNNALNINNAVINNELSQGEFSWIARANGNYGLLWKGV